MAVTPYATATELDQILSEFAITTRLDDDGGGEEDDNLRTAAIEQASAKINQFLLNRSYSVATLAASAWVKWATAYLAVCIICRRQGNDVPESIAAECDYYEEELIRIRDGKAELTDDDGMATPAHDFLPTVSNVRIDRRFASGKIRRQKSISTGQDASPPTKQHDADEDLIIW